MGASLGSVAVRRAGGAWPPTAEREAVELSTAAVLGILVGAVLLELLVFVGAAGSGLRAVSPFGPGTDPVFRNLVVPGAITLGISVGLVLALGWQRAAGITRGKPSRWGTIPLCVLWIGAVLTMGRVAASMPGGTIPWIVLLGLAFAAVAEEVLFRGFLLHGLTRSMGGRAAVLLGSATFAAAHLPSLVASRVDGGTIGITVLVLFGLAILLCRIRTETGSIWFCSGVHTLWNFVTLGVVGRGVFGGLSLAIVALKLTPVVVGLVLAVRLFRGRVAIATPTAPTFLPPPPPLPGP